MTFPILFEDAELLAVDKPPGVTVIPARGEDPAASLQHLLAAERGERLYVVHRIDRDTSGVVLFARTAEAHRTLSLAFERREIEKTYRAFTAGRPPDAAGGIDLALHEARKGKSRPARSGEPGSQPARTDYRVLRTWVKGETAMSELELRPHTGRHHQIRVHLRAISCPVLGDDVYGRAALDLMRGSPCSRLALHAFRIAVGGRAEIEAPLPADLVALAGWLDATLSRG